MCQGSEYDMVIYAMAAETSECLNMAQYASWSEYASVFLNVPQNV